MLVKEESRLRDSSSAEINILSNKGADFMDRDILRRLELLNQLSLTETQKEEVLAFFAGQEKEMEILEAIDTSDVEGMVHVMPILTVVREDVVSQPFAREELQHGAPETDEGYWCVPRVMD